MSAKYTRIPTSDPDCVSLNFDTIHTYDSDQNYGKPFGGYGTDSKSRNSQFKSAFTYSGGFNPNRKCEPVGEWICVISKHADCTKSDLLWNMFK